MRKKHIKIRQVHRTYIDYGVPFEKESTFFIRFAMLSPRLED